MHRPILAFVLVFLAASACFAQAPKSLFLEDLTWTEVRDATAAGKTTILVPIGGTEQNGPHMALGKHNARAKFLAERIAAALGDALVAPVVAYVPEGPVNPPAAHMRFPGTITVPEDTFEKLLESAARSFRLHGFRNVVLLGDHGGYRKSLLKVAERLNREWAGTPARIIVPDAYYRASDEGFAQILKGKGFRPEEIGTHAGLGDTSLALAIDPALVRADRLASGGRASEGVHGDPRKATAELGRLGVDLIVERTAEAIRKAAPRR
jgi:creatinine amidohydrolase